MGEWKGVRLLGLSDGRVFGGVSVSVTKHETQDVQPFLS